MKITLVLALAVAAVTGEIINNEASFIEDCHTAFMDVY